MTIIKSELVSSLSKKLLNIPEKVISKGVNQILIELSEVLAVGGRIEIRDFGSFSLHYRPPRNAHNPKTGAKVITEAKYSPHFKPGKELRERVNAARTYIAIAEDSRDTDSDE